MSTEEELERISDVALLDIEAQLIACTGGSCKREFGPQGYGKAEKSEIREGISKNGQSNLSRNIF